jgi:hypothetical protein
MMYPFQFYVCDENDVNLSIFRKVRNRKDGTVSMFWGGR